MANEMFGGLDSLSKEELEKELKRIFGSFPKDFKLACVALMRNKAQARLKIIREEMPDKTPLEHLEMAWAEISLEMIMILADDVKQKAAKLDAVAHLMPEAPSTRQ